jgi:CheY-like chemotaxis protein
MSDMNITILHVEDDPALVKLVQVVFQSLGFHGDMLTAERVEDALTLLGERARNRQPIDLILLNMQLPDGTGLDVVREVRADPFWQLTPVLVLSEEIAPGEVSEAYALGANCYIPKSGKTIMKSLRALFECWVDSALLPLTHAGDRVHECLSRAINLRARTSGIYLRLADLVAATPGETQFWLQRSLSEGNLSNLFALFRHKIDEKDFPPGTIERLTKMQGEVEKTLRTAEKRLKGAAPDSPQIYYWALDLVEAVDEEIFAECLGFLFPKSPAATMALKERACAHYNELAAHILERAAEPELRQRAETLRNRAGRIASAPGPGSSCSFADKGTEKAQP